MKEIKTKSTEIIEKEGSVQEEKRKGLTTITSVSVSKEFRDIVDEYNLSPTEVFRRGVAVMLFDLGIRNYQNPKNEERSIFVKQFLKEIKDEEEKIELFEKLVKFSEEVLKIKEKQEELEGKNA